MADNMYEYYDLATVNSVVTSETPGKADSNMDTNSHQNSSVVTTESLLDEKKSDVYHDMSSMGYNSNCNDSDDFIYGQRNVQGTQFLQSSHGSTNPSIEQWKHTISSSQQEESNQVNMLPSPRAPFNEQTPLSEADLIQLVKCSIGSSNLETVSSATVSIEPTNFDNKDYGSQGHQSSQMQIIVDETQPKSDYKIRERTIQVKLGTPVRMIMKPGIPVNKLIFTMEYHDASYKNMPLKKCSNNGHKICNICQQDHPFMFCVHKIGGSSPPKVTDKSLIMNLDSDFNDDGNFVFTLTCKCWNSCVKQSKYVKDLDLKIQLLQNENLIKTEVFKINCIANLNRGPERKRKNVCIEKNINKKMRCEDSYSFSVTMSSKEDEERIRDFVKRLGGTVHDEYDLTVT